ncbi:MAG: hypothetical protein RDV48_00895 [Candidatus Eremiobacteraeota bacterium]|nr:hypothetical protein [Candidatus Eremiobacteraeota bacterium]
MDSLQRITSPSQPKPQTGTPAFPGRKMIYHHYHKDKGHGS